MSSSPIFKRETLVENARAAMTSPRALTVLPLQTMHEIVSSFVHLDDLVSTLTAVCAEAASHGALIDPAAMAAELKAFRDTKGNGEPS